MPPRRKTEPAELYDGEITALVAHRGRDVRVAVYLDRRRAFDLSALVAERAGLCAGATLTAEVQRELLQQDEPFRARERALRLLALRDRTRREVESRLRQAGFAAEAVASTIEWLTGLGYLDDGRFASVYAAEKRRGGWGARRIEAELAAKGVDRRMVEEVMAALGEAEAGAGAPDAEGRHAGDLALETTVRRRFSRDFAADPAAAERRLAGFLARRGHDWDTIGRMVRMLRAEADAEPDSPSIP